MNTERWILPEGWTKRTRTSVECWGKPDLHPGCPACRGLVQLASALPRYQGTTRSGQTPWRRVLKRASAVSTVSYILCSLEPCDSAPTDSVDHFTLPTEREHTDVRKMLRKKSIEVQRDRYPLSERTELVFGMSNDTKKI